jgi:hypothetical protein
VSEWEGKDRDRVADVQRRSRALFTCSDLSGRGRTIVAVGYWQAKSDLAFMVQFRADVLELYEHEGRALQEIRQRGAFMTTRDVRNAIPAVANQNDVQGYQAVRARLATEMSRAVRIGRQLGVPADAVSYPAPAVGGPVIPFNLFEATLSDPSHGDGVDRQTVIDTLNRAVGAAHDKMNAERKHLYNPAWWLWSAVSFVLRIPFIIISATGLRIDKFEAGVGGIVVKVAEAVLIAYVLTRLKLN